MSRRLLLVDDAQDIRAIARLSLERIGGWTVVPVASGREALQAVAEDRPFDAVVLDVMMPAMDGPTTLTELRGHGLGADVPVVFLTAKAQAAEHRQLVSLGAVGVIVKPFDPMALPEEIQRMLGKRDAGSTK